MPRHTGWSHGPRRLPKEPPARPGHACSSPALPRLETRGEAGSTAAGNHHLAGPPPPGSSKGRGKQGTQPLTKHCSPKIRSSVVDSSKRITCDERPAPQDGGNGLARAEMAAQRPGPSGSRGKDQVTYLSPARGSLCTSSPLFSMASLPPATAHAVTLQARLGASLPHTPTISVTHNQLRQEDGATFTNRPTK